MRGAGTSDALTETFGYSGQELVTVTTPYTGTQPHTWQLGYDPQGRVTRITSPISGQLGQAGYTPSVTTEFTYGVSQTTAIEGYGSGQPLTHTYTLDAQGQATQRADGLGNTSSASYDLDHDVLASTDANGNTTTNAYQYIGPTGSTGLVTQTVRPAVNVFTPRSVPNPIVTTYRYDPHSYDLLETDTPAGGIERYAYDGNHSVVTTTLLTGYAGCGGATTGVVHPFALPSCTYVWQPRVTRYDAYGEHITEIDGRGLDVTGDATPTVTLDPTTAISYTSHMAYDAQGDQTSESTPPITTTLNGNTTALVTTTQRYDGDGNQISNTSANGNTTTDAYDHLGRPISTTLPPIKLYDNTTTTPMETTGYDGDGNVVASTDANGALTTSSYDPLGRQVATTNPVSGTMLMTYTATDLAATQDMAGNVSHDAYDGAGRLILASDPATGTVGYGYDAVGNTTAITAGDTSGAVTQRETRQYDAQNRVMTDTVGGAPGSGAPALTTATYYDYDGNVAQVRQPQGDTTVTIYDFLDRPTSTEIDTAVVDAPTKQTVETQTYDAAGNVNSRIDFDGRTHLAQYDADNRAVQSTDYYSFTATLTTTTGYDPDGNTLSQVQQTQGPTGPAQTHTITNTYNAADWQMSTTDDGLTTGYGYDAAGQQRSHTILNGTTPVTMVVDPEGRTTSIAENMGGTGPYTSTYGYNQNDLVTSATMPGPVQEQVGYDPNSRLISMTATGPNTGSSATTLNSAYAYGYNAVGWTTGLTWTVNGAVTTTQLQHDAQGRLTRWAGQLNGPETWSYDGNGNIISNTEYLEGMQRTSVYTYSPSVPNEQLQGHTNGLGVEYRTYDHNGDTTSITSTDPITSHYHVDMRLSYDSQARPITVTTLQNGVPLTVTMGYNADGQRARYTVAMSGTTTTDERFQYRDGDLAQMAAMTATLNSDGSIQSTGQYTDTYLYNADGQPLELLRQQGGATRRYWYTLDGRGNVVALTNSNGAVVDRYAYDPWGEGLPEGTSETVAQPFRYAGYWWDKDLGWYWVSVRSYDPEGRWLQPDPSQQDGVRTYVYVADDPIDFTDPSGLGSQPTPTPTPPAGPTTKPTPIPSSQIGPCGQHGQQYAYCHSQESSSNWVVVAWCTSASRSVVYLADGGWPTCGATWPGLGSVIDDLPPSGYIDPFLVRFTQDSADWHFKDKATRESTGTIDDLVKGLRDGSIRPEDIPPIKVVLRDGQLWSLDNRRLEAFRRAGIPIRYRLVNWSRSVANEWKRKFTTRNNGESIRLRGEPQDPADLEPLIDPIEPIEPIDPIL